LDPKYAFSLIDIQLYSDQFIAALDLRYIHICSKFRSTCLFRVYIDVFKFRSVHSEFRSEFMFICDQKLLLSFLVQLAICPISVYVTDLIVVSFEIKKKKLLFCIFTLNLTMILS
jgi:hypothetical protein